MSAHNISMREILSYGPFAGDHQPFLRTIFTLSSCLPIEGSQVFSYDTEEEMLMAWKDFVIKVDPDVMTGYNIGRFDIPYLLLRAQKLKLDKFPFLGRLRGQIGFSFTYSNGC
jgi:DNA polymerase delta subunit 1